ncbi:ubiquinone biosynthesis protein [Asanoa ishikariensis]|uniref:23S rRNA m(1)G-748 methyltransferase n=1 Tax=Asanoa ishikariensis TaxID=137265 RepID=A0A1H3QRS6_9ACTN|nr:23S rRNA methyltransferase [Asanoa ishikariensis]GIF64760.1 ubiquinone biosynthesis protein [Asanoa ishikariensis]SDZ16040.1 23S rRNA m(1)G-748 methyltransferase [Asanoa ishikariensis]
MNRDVVAYLRCPVCREPLHVRERTLRCPRGHSFDLARQGYADLSAGRSPHTGDTPEMVAARDAFLASGHYAFVSAALAEAAGGAAGIAVDVGGGTGQHLKTVLDANPALHGLVLDASKPALRRAARVHERAGAVRTDAWGRLPLADHDTAVLLDVFAPRNGAEFHRVLRPDGRLLVVTPEPDHLAELVTALGLLSVDPAKEERLAASLDAHFTLTRRRSLRSTLRLDRDEVATVVGMGPSAWHRDAATIDLPTPVDVTAAIRLDEWTPR